MADLYQPKTWVDGEQLTAVNSANRWENGLEALDVDLDDLRDTVTALQAGGGSSRPFQSGPSENRPSPAIGLPYYDTGLTPPRVIVGTGSAWTEMNGSPVTSTSGGGTGGTPLPGTSGAPVLTSTVTEGGTIGAINLTWTAVSGATSYKVYETESPSGVSGATALTTTSSTRTPNTARNYEYWVTALVSGVESAASNRIQATLPYVAGGGTGGGGSTPSSNPSTFLNINGLGTGTGGWWNLGVGLSSAHVDIDPTALKSYVNSPYYTLNSTGTAVQFQVYMDGAKTSSGTKYPRSELREFATGSTTAKAAWSGTSGRHRMSGTSAVLHYAPNKCEVCLAQIHDTKDVGGGTGDDMLQIRAEASSATGAQTWRLSIKGSEVKDLISGVALGQEVAWEIDLNNGALTVKINGTVQYTGNPGFPPGLTNYFKVGEYVQQNVDNGNASTEYGRSTLRNLFVSHT